ncbi:MAG: type IV pilus biogenesis/stability protein PilW [Psychromonas sp.]|nr:type IV pilus biogenesis/stability protein PilW [Psychromonas sp.]
MFLIKNRSLLLIFVLITLIAFISGCVTSQVSVAKKHTTSGYKTSFEPDRAAKKRMQLALIYLKNDKMQQAKANLQKALEYQPDSAIINRVFAYYYQKVNEPKIAEKFYKKSISLDPKDGDTYNNYGRFLCIKGRYKAAEKNFLMAIKQTSYLGVANTYENAGLCAEKAGDKNKAIYYYGYALSYDPNKSFLNLSLAKLNIDKKNFKAANLNLYSYKKKNKDSAESLWQLIRLSYATEKTANLNKYAGKLLSDFPESQQAINYLNQKYTGD